MSDDIVKRLHIATMPTVQCVKREAADEITRLRAQIAELETEDCNWMIGGALQRFMETPDG